MLCTYCQTIVSGKNKKNITSLSAEFAQKLLNVNPGPVNLEPASVAQLDAGPTGDQEVAGSTPARSAPSFMEFDYEIFPMVIVSLPLIQEGQLSVSDKRMCTILVNHLED